jgi:titin
MRRAVRAFRRICAVSILATLSTAGALYAQPSAPQNVNASAASTTSIDLSWDPVPGANGGYRIYRDGAFLRSTSATSATNTGLQPSTTYTYTVTAVDGFDQESVPSDPAQATTLSEPPPAPASLTATAVSATQIDVSWQAVSDPVGINHYVVYRDGAQVATVVGTSYSDTGLQPETTYRYQVTAVNTADLEGPPSQQAQATTDSAPPPAAPASANATAVSPTQVNVAWSAVSDPFGISSYNVYRDGSLAATVGGTNWSDTGLQPSTTYTYQVTAVNSLGVEGAPSPSAQATTQDPPPPAAPSSLDATAVSSTRIDLDWPNVSDPFGISGYNVYRNGSFAANVASSNWSDTGLQPLTTYRYRVRSVNSFGQESGNSPEASATTLDGTPPTAPGNLTGQAVSSSRIDLAWDAATDPDSDIDEYIVYRNGSRVATTSGNDTDYRDTGLSNYTEYRYEVAAVNADGLEGPKSNSISVRTRDGTAPSKPQNLKANAVSANRIDLTWNASTDSQSGISHYIVYRDGDSVAAPTATNYSDNGLAPITRYEYRVSAVNGDGLEGTKSTLNSATTPDGSPPGPPGDPVASSVTSTSLNLDWAKAEDPESGIKEYIVYRNGAPIASTADTTYQDAGLTPATEYQYAIAAVNNEGQEGSTSGVTIVNTVDDTPPTNPSSLIATAASTTEVDIAWAAADDPETGIAAYIVYRDGDSVAQTQSTVIRDSLLTPNTTYEYRVSAVNGDGLEGERSDPASATTPPAIDQTPPPPPSDLTAVASGPTRVDLAWSAVDDPDSGVSAYRVYRNDVLLASTATTGFQDITAEPETQYTYRVSAVNGDGVEGEKSEGQVVTTPPVTDVIPPAAPTGLRRVGP